MKTSMESILTATRNPWPKGVSMKSILIVARLDEMGFISLQDGQTLADVAKAIEEMETE